MVWDIQAVVRVLALIIFVWLGVVSVVVVRMVRHYNRLTRGVTQEGLRGALDAILANQEGLTGRTQKIQSILEALDQTGKHHIQRIGIVRFNPFSDTGGSQSFTLAILDGLDNGIVTTSLFARTGNRWYIKEIRSGKGRDMELSKEEQTAIKRAQQSESIHT